VATSGSERTSAAQRTGAVLIGVGVIEFVVAMAWTQTAYPGYSLLQNYISDLGNTATSPLHNVFNVGIILLGILAFVGILLSWSAFPAGPTRPVGLPLFLLASVAAILVGVFQENTHPAIHDLVSLLVFAPGGVGLVVLGIGMHPRTSWSWMRWVSIAGGLVTLLSLLYYVPTQASNTTFDPGLIERLIVVPILVWGFLVAVVILRRPARPHLAAV
jgi:hypothetical membrane protein